MASPTPRSVPVRWFPADAFIDPYLLDFFGLHDGYLEAALLRDLEAFLLEIGSGFTFVERQKRRGIGGKDFHLDLLLYHRPLKALPRKPLNIVGASRRIEAQFLGAGNLARHDRRTGSLVSMS